MSLIDFLTDKCQQAYHAAGGSNGCGNCGNQCTHPSGQCSGSCRECSEQVHYHQWGGRQSYDCEQFMRYYVCRYSWKYCSEIMYALDMIDLAKYPRFSILSVGCGPAPDLMAFELKVPETKEIFYRGYDINPYWTPIHKAIGNYVKPVPGIDAKFSIKDFFQVLADGKPRRRHYNVISLQYLISYFPDNVRLAWAATLFDGLIRNVISNRLDDSPFLIIINDTDSYASQYFDLLLKKLATSGFHGTYSKYHFRDRNKDYGDGSEQHSTSWNCFQIPGSMKDEFNCAIQCSSAQLIVELE